MSDRFSEGRRVGNWQMTAGSWVHCLNRRPTSTMRFQVS